MLPRLAITSWPISFLVDTGASRCMIAPADARNMGLTPTDLAGNEEVEGISGVEVCFREEAYLVFTDDDGQNHYYNFNILISRRDPEELERMPSLLGRDVLNRWTMHYSPHNPDPSLTFEVISDDLILPADLGPRG